MFWFSWCCIENDNDFERNEDRATEFLKWTDFRFFCEFIYFLIFRSGFVWYAPCHWWIMEFNIFKAKTSPNTCHGHYWSHECQNPRWSPGWCNVQKLSPFRTSRIQVCTYILKLSFSYKSINFFTKSPSWWEVSWKIIWPKITQFSLNIFQFSVKLMNY